MKLRDLLEKKGPENTVKGVVKLLSSKIGVKLSQWVFPHTGEALLIFPIELVIAKNKSSWKSTFGTKFDCVYNAYESMIEDTLAGHHDEHADIDDLKFGDFEKIPRSMLGCLNKFDKSGQKLLDDMVKSGEVDGENSPDIGWDEVDTSNADAKYFDKDKPHVGLFFSM